MSTPLRYGRWGDSTSLRFPPIFYRTLVEILKMPYNDYGTIGIVYIDRGDSNDLRQAAHERAPPQNVKSLRLQSVGF